ncbi:hypothetical protein EAF00_003650 [Botryotinia globosa]|nr:hypothetical protein EAF00_003650 [Botryotinia globosa]
MPTPEELRKRSDKGAKDAQENRAAMNKFDPEVAKGKRDRKAATRRENRQKLAEENPKKARARMDEINRKAKERDINNPEIARMERDRKLQLRSDAKRAKEQAAVSKRNESFTSSTSDNRSVGPESTKVLESDSTLSPDHNSAFTMTGMRTSLPPSNPGQTAHSRSDFPPTKDHYNPLSMNNIGYSAPPNTQHLPILSTSQYSAPPNTHTHIQTANSRSDPPPTIYCDSGPPTNSNNSLSLAGVYVTARPEMPARYESAGFGTSFAQPISGHYYSSSTTSYEPPVPPSITVPTADSMYDYSQDELNRWWNKSMSQDCEEGNLY